MIKWIVQNMKTHMFYLSTSETENTHLEQALCLVGEFNNWTPKDNQWAFKNPFGVWELFLADNADGTPVIPHK